MAKYTYKLKTLVLIAALTIGTLGCSSGPQELRYSKPHLGMTKDEVTKKTWWSSPDDTSTSEMHGHTYETWYWGRTGKRSVIFDNNRVIIVNE
jgi:hypothetical protein